MLNAPRIIKIKNIVEENPEVKTLIFKDVCEALPGQFIMVWIPGIDEVPMSLSYIDDDKGFTFKKVGEATEALYELKNGDRIGIRGPLGGSFKLTGDKILAVAGGIGIAPLAPFIESAVEGGKDVTLAFGAKTKTELLFLKRLEESCNKLDLATDDGTFGYHGFISDLAAEILNKENFDAIVTCGPEIMMKKVVDLGVENKIPVQASLERYVKCGVGICDSCAINGFLVCKDGPVFSHEILGKLKDFGKAQRDTSGRKVGL
jgi:dihydroorotate dehydrogenase electron transfer subunit